MSVALIAGLTAVCADGVDALTVVHLREKVRGYRREHRLAVANQVMAIEADEEADTQYVYKASELSRPVRIVEKAEKGFAKAKSARKRAVAEVKTFKAYREYRRQQVVVAE